MLKLVSKRKLGTTGKFQHVAVYAELWRNPERDTYTAQIVEYPNGAAASMCPMKKQGFIELAKAEAMLSTLVKRYIEEEKVRGYFRED